MADIADQYSVMCNRMIVAMVLFSLVHAVIWGTCTYTSKYSSYMHILHQGLHV